MNPSVVIVGAGAAGIAAATRLISNGFNNVTILEAENRIGGRIYSTPVAETIIDLGAQWIHGEKGNIVYEMVADLDVTSHNASADYNNISFITLGDDIPNDDLIKNLWKLAQQIVDSGVGASQEESLGSYFQRKFHEKVEEEYGQADSVMKASKLIEDWASKFYLCLDAADTWYDISVANLEMYRHCEGDPLINWKNNGYHKLIDILTKNVTTDDLLQHIILNKEVCRILWDQKYQSSEKIQIECTDGSSYYADHVIVTVSVGVLRNMHENCFQPKLPPAKINCIENIPLGINLKIFLKFPRRWWPSKQKDFSFLWSEEDRTELLKEFPSGPIINGRSWLEFLFGFYTVDADSTFLLGWFVGPMTKDVEMLSDELILDGSLFLLKKFLGNTYDIPEPERVVRSCWANNPHFCGTYSYVSNNTVKSGASHEELGKPLCVGDKEMILFAGEATHPHYFSTVHGAIETGFREADRLINKYKDINHVQVAIVGAGIAGLAASNTLIENGIQDFLLLEAQAEPGGRIKTVYVDNKPLDLGAQWIHGKDHLLYKLAKDNQLLSDEESEEGLGDYIRSNGEVVDPYLVSLVSFKVGQILQSCAALSQCPTAHQTSVKDFLEANYSQWLNDQEVDKIDTFTELFDWHVRFQVIDNSCIDLSRLSAKCWGDYICKDDEAHGNLKYGYNSIIEVLMKNIPKTCIRFNSEVRTIKLSVNNIILYLRDDRVITCDHLIMTPSMGVLKKMDGISAILPNTIKSNIENMGFAGICKIYLLYEEKWWGSRKGLQLLWNKQCKYFDGCQWLRHITGFDEVFNHNTTLVTWVGGDGVEEVEALSSGQIGKQCTMLLRKFVDHSVPEPRRVIRTQWLNNPFIRGSYCHITPECDSENAGIRELMKPFIVDGTPRIILAGEAIHPSHYSTVHGAYESGLQQTKIITDFLKKCNT